MFVTPTLGLPLIQSGTAPAARLRSREARRRSAARPADHGRGRRAAHTGAEASWRGLFRAGRDLARRRGAVIETECRKAVAVSVPDVRERIVKLGLRPVRAARPSEFRPFLADAIKAVRPARWSKLAGIEPE